MAKKSKHDLGIMRRFVRDAVVDRIATSKRQRRMKKRRNKIDDRPLAALLFGVGAEPGIGAAIAQRAASGGLKVYICGRSQDKLAATAESIRRSGGEVEVLICDVSQPDAIQAAFQRVAQDACRLDLVVHNVGTNRPKAFLDITPESMQKAWENDCRSGFLIGQQAVETMLEQTGTERGLGTVIFTGASASLRGKEGFATFAQAKAGLRMLAQAMAREYGPQGIHVVHTIIDGMVDGARLREHMPEMLNGRGEVGALNPQAIAETYWALHQQHRSVWTHEVDLRPHKEAW